MLFWAPHHILKRIPNIHEYFDQSKRWLVCLSVIGYFFRQNKCLLWISFCEKILWLQHILKSKISPFEFLVLQLDARHLATLQPNNLEGSPRNPAVPHPREWNKLCHIQPETSNQNGLMLGTGLGILAMVLVWFAPEFCPNVPVLQRYQTPILRSLKRKGKGNDCFFSWYTLELWDCCRGDF